MIIVDKASKAINRKVMFDNISLRCSEKETYVLVGPNGIGKTSLLKSILGLYSIDSGYITLLGQKIDRNYKTDSKVGVFFDTAKMLPHSNVKETLIFFTSLYGKSLTDIDSTISCLRLENELDKTYISLSSGNKRKIGLLISLINNPDLLIWDEPFATLDPEMCSELADFINQLKKDGKTILITTNDLYSAKDIYDKVGFFVDSNSIIERSKDELLVQYPDKNLNEIYFLVKDEFQNNKEGML